MNHKYVQLEENVYAKEIDDCISRFEQFLKKQ